MGRKPNKEPKAPKAPKKSKDDTSGVPQEPAQSAAEQAATPATPAQQSGSSVPSPLPVFEGSQVTEVLQENVNGKWHHCKLSNGTTAHVPIELFK